MSVRGTLLPRSFPWATVGKRLAASTPYGTFSDLLRLLSDGAWWHNPLIRPGSLSVIVLLSTIVWTLRTGLLLALLLQLTSMIFTLGSRHFRLRHLRHVAHALGRQSSQHGSAMTSWEGWDVSENTRRQVERLREANGVRELVIARIDRGGRVLGLFGPLPGIPAVCAAEFVPGGRFRLDIVVIADRVLVRKDFQGDRVRFYAEWATLAYLAGRVNVPAVHFVNERRGVIYKDLVLGKTIRDILVGNGAKILSAQTTDDPALESLPRQSRKRAIEARGTSFLRRSLPDDVLNEVERQTRLIHEFGVTGVSTTFQNVVIEESSRAPWFIDCEHGRIHRSKDGWRFNVVKEHERVRFVRRYARGPDATDPPPPTRTDTEPNRAKA